MRIFDYLIIGGGIAGTAAAELLRERDSHAKVAMLSGEENPLYSKVRIPSYLKKRIVRDELFLRKISDYETRGISFFPGALAQGLDREKQEIILEDGRAFPYKKLLIAAGGRPRGFSFGLPQNVIKILRMHTLADADEIKSFIENANEKEVLVTGENLIASEFLEIFVVNGFRVHAAARGNFWGEKRLGKAGAEISAETFANSGVILHKNADIGSFSNGEIYFKNGEHLRVPAVGIGIGLERNLEAFSSLHVSKGIITNEFLESSDPNIYAAGDIAEYFDVVSGATRLSGSWTTAFLQGKIAAANMLATFQEASNSREAFRSVPSYNIKNLGLGISFVGYLDDADDIWERTAGIFKRRELVRVFLKNGKVRGAVLINRFNDKITLAEFVEQNKEISRNELEKIFT